MKIWQRPTRKTAYAVVGPQGRALCPICNRYSHTITTTTGIFVIKRTCRHFHERRLQNQNVVLVFIDGYHDDYDQELKETIKWILNLAARTAERKLTRCLQAVKKRWPSTN